MSFEKIPSVDSFVTGLNSIFNFKANCNPKNKKNSKESTSLINDEYCYNCNEGGNLINCDRCPASFHLLCHNPPLDIDQIPKGEFLCNKCKNNSKIGINNSENKTTTIHFEKYETDTALDTLCRMAKSLNPKEMSLSNEMSLQCEFSIPGLSRIKWFANEYRLKTVSLQNKNSNCFSNRRMCQVCSKFELSKKMIKCDYCESIYHQDCLFLLINEIPTKDKIWMCPLHCEHLLNFKLLKSQKLSDQIKLWNDFELLFKKQKKIENAFIEKCGLNTVNTLNEKSILRSYIPATIKSLYNQNEEQVCSSSSCFSEYTSAVEALNLLSNKRKEFKIKIDSLSRHDLIKPKALLKFVSDEYDLFEYPIPLVKSCTSLGKSLKNDICLANDFIQCKHVSDRHATIFYDFSSNTYEILNYSEHGTRVDYVKLGFEINGLENNHSAEYEGSVELKHGSFIQIGCFKFIFVIIDYDLKKKNENGFKSKEVKKNSLKTNNEAKKIINKNLINKLDQVKKMCDRPSSLIDPEITTLTKFIRNSNKKKLII